MRPSLAASSSNSASDMTEAYHADDVYRKTHAGRILVLEGALPGWLAEAGFGLSADFGFAIHR